MPENAKNLNLLADYADRQTLARELGTSTRTIANYESEGLPSQMLGGRKIYNLLSVRDWLKERQVAV